MSIDRQAIEGGCTTLGIELGSSRIKAVLIGPDYKPLSTGEFAWENQLVDRLWTYPLAAAWQGIQACYRDLVAEVSATYGVQLTSVGALGISGMMHGYLAFDAAGELLVPFRTWRNTNTGEAVDRLSAAFDYNIPHRWSVAHLYQAILDGADHVGRVAYLTTLAGYIHWQLTGEKVIGVGDASGMFPIDTTAGDYDATMLRSFDRLAAEAGWGLTLRDLLPVVQSAGQLAGRLSPAGARLLDPTGQLQGGVPLCPPEGDAGTGMVATNSVAPRTGNISAGTSIFAMVVLDQDLRRRHRELDLVTTPAGDLVAMVHCNNGASELNAWVGLFIEFARLRDGGASTADTEAIFSALFNSALGGAPDCDGMLAYNYLAGEPITELEEGRPLFLRRPDGRFDLATFMRTQLFAAFGTLRIGMDVLQQGEGVRLERMFAHGGMFKTKGVAQQLLAAAINAPVTVGSGAGEGGAWGIAVLAAYSTEHRGRSLTEFLAGDVFAGAELVTISPQPADVAGFEEFMRRYVAALPVQLAAIQHS